MDRTVVLDGADLLTLIAELQDITRPPIRTLRVTVGPHGLKLKVNDQPWSGPIGHIEDLM